MKPLAFLRWASPIFLVYAQTVHAADGDNDLAQQQESQLPAGADTIRVNCLDAMNKARSRAGLPAFADGSKNSAAALPVDELAFKKYMCFAVQSIAEVKGPYTEGRFDEETGTLAYFPQDGSPVDCAAAVEKWKSAFANFEGLPPVFKEIESPYDNYQNLAFLALFNPKPNAAADCAFATCPIAAAAKDGKQTAGTTRDYHGLFCRTVPRVLEAGSAPFTTEQWDKITESFTNAASFATPAFFTFAAAALAVAFL